MRTALWTLLVVALALGAFWLVDPLGWRAGSSEGPPLESGETPPVDPALADRLRLPHGTVTFRIRTPDGIVPLGMEVGYRKDNGETRWLYANEEGVRTLTDVPLGKLVCVARGPGYPEVEQVCHVAAGVPASVILAFPGPDSPDSPDPGG